MNGIKQCAHFFFFNGREDNEADTKKLSMNEGAR